MRARTRGCMCVCAPSACVGEAGEGIGRTFASAAVSTPAARAICTRCPPQSTHFPAEVRRLSGSERPRAVATVTGSACVQARARVLWSLWGEGVAEAAAARKEPGQRRCGPPP